MDATSITRQAGQYTMVTFKANIHPIYRMTPESKLRSDKPGSHFQSEENPFNSNSDLQVTVPWHSLASSCHYQNQKQNFLYLSRKGNSFITAAKGQCIGLLLFFKVSIYSGLAQVWNVICAIVRKRVGCGLKYGGFGWVQVCKIRPVQDLSAHFNHLAK